MSRLFALPNGNLIDPTLIHGVKAVKNKGVILINEFNKILDFLQYPDALSQKTIRRVLRAVNEAGRDWEQAVWEFEFDLDRKHHAPGAREAEPA